MPIKHKFVSPRTDSADASLVRPSRWNEDHNVTIGGQRLMGRSAQTPGEVGEVALGAGLAFEGSSVKVTAIGDWNNNTIVSELAKKFDLTGGETTHIDITKTYPTLKLHRPGVQEWFIQLRENGHLHFFSNGGQFHAATFHNNGNVSMTGRGDIPSIIEARGAAWSNDRISQLGYRLVSEYSAGRGAVHLHAGSVCTGVYTTSVGYLMHFYARYMQVFDPVRGWVQFWND